jgi:hypothetical protein
MWTTFLQRVKTAALGQVRKIPAGIRKAIAYKLLRHALTWLGGLLVGAGWISDSFLTACLAAVPFAAGIALSVLDAYLVDEKIKAAKAPS